MEAASLSCSICVDTFGNRDDICSTVCGHIFHFSCLLKWQQRSNTCPLCNRSNPQPHRLFLDLKSLINSQTNDCKDTKVVIKSIPPHMITDPLSGVVLKLASHAFGHKELLIKNKAKLKSNAETSGIVIHQFLDSDTKALFSSAHRLKKCGYSTIFVNNREVFAKKSRNGAAIQILSKQHVDMLCAQAPSQPQTITVHGNQPHTSVVTTNPQQHSVHGTLTYDGEATGTSLQRTDSDPAFNDLHWNAILSSFENGQLYADSFIATDRLSVISAISDVATVNPSNERPPKKSLRKSIASAFKKIRDKFT